jgi:phosphoglucomutase
VVHELAGKPVPRRLLANIPRLISAYYTYKPDVSDPAHCVAFGTSGHRGSSFKSSFNEDHILAISQAICEYRKSKDITGPLFMGMDTHALSEPALATAIEVFAANEVTVLVQKGLRYTPTPVISHAILMVSLSPLPTTRLRTADSSITHPKGDRRPQKRPKSSRRGQTRFWAVASKV